MGTDNAYKYMESSDILLHLLLAKFTASLIIFQKEQFSLILRIITWKMNDRNKPKDSNHNDKSNTNLNSSNPKVIVT